VSPDQLRFSIQSSAPVAQPAERAADLAQAIYEIYPMDTEDAILNWNLVAVRVGYRYDVSVMIDDALPLLTAIAGSDIGERSVTWGSDTFNATWDVTWVDDALRATGEWRSISGDYEHLLNDRPTVSIKRAAFLAEWSGLLETVLRGVEASGVSLERPEQLTQLRDLVSRTRS
jgi:hypothetical protein